MSAGSFIQWLALALCVIFAATRLPDALRGKGRSIFAVLVLLCVAVGLSLAPIYLFVDGLLGGANIANLLIRFSLYAIMLLLVICGASELLSESEFWMFCGTLGAALL